jgi:hypothetical protein
MSTKYKASDILFGLRQEYVELAKKLNSMSELTDVSMNRHLTSVRYRVIPSEMSEQLHRVLFEDKPAEEPRILSDLIRNPKTIFGLISRIEEKLTGNYSFYYWCSSVKKDESGRYIITRDGKTPTEGKYKAVIPAENQEAFGRFVDELLSSPMYSVENLERLKSDDEKSVILLHYFPHLIGEEGFDFKFSDSYEEASSHGEGELITTISKMFNAEFDGDSLTEYQKDLIAQSGVQGKKIYFAAERPVLERAIFSIEEDEKDIVLVKK